MIRLLIPLLLVVIGFVLARRYLANSTSPAQKKSRQITVALVVFAIVMIILALLHRMHWLGALIAALAPLGRILVTTALDYFHQRKAASTNSATEAVASHKMSEEEALQILGLKKPFTQEEVIDAHRKLMQKIHPDRGGNDYLAARINEAKAFLLKLF